MKTFIHDNFLLENKTAELLFHETAKDLPIIDYHNHVVPKHLAENFSFEDLAQLWVVPDQYKHRAMRINGIPESGVTGHASPKEKFLNWAKTSPKTLGNPLFHWGCLEMKRFFGIDEMLNESTAESIWSQCNEQLQGDGYSSIDLLKKCNVELLCTSDDLLDNLSHHVAATDCYGIRVSPSLRGDSMLNFTNDGYSDWLEELCAQTNIEIKDIASYKEAIRSKLNNYKESGCLLADHSLDAGFEFQLPTEKEAANLFAKQLSGEELTSLELNKLQCFMLVFLGKEYAKKGWVLQLHIGAQRKTSTRLKTLAGTKGGFASIGRAVRIADIVEFLDSMEREGLLPKIILFTLNPSDNEAFATLTGSFAEDDVKAKIQFGPGWWYNDHYSGLRDQMTTLASYGMISHFIGMTTDSRSLLSFSRHEYFRRVLCSLLGEWTEKGHLPSDENLLKEFVADICYGNAKDWIKNRKEILVNGTVER